MNPEREISMYQHVRNFSILGLVLTSWISLSGCATKKFVRHEVGKLEPKIADNSAAIRETNERLDALDRSVQQGLAGVASAEQKAAAAARDAAAAAQAASAADSRAAAADRKADAASQNAQQANAKANTIESRVAKAGNYVDAYAVGTPQVIVFKTNSDALSGSAKQTLDAVASGIAGEQSGYLIEIHGFTDTTGAERYNVTLSQRRADSALRYLVRKGVPVYRTSLVGLGEESPVANNESSNGRQQNRRVEIRVLRIATGDGSN
jgi:outer membrane protein OmpA-like peptidoglycan-associated protein